MFDAYSQFMMNLREFNALSVILRLLLAVALGGLIGLEREHKRRPAGFRTHILICVGAALTTLTSEYLVLQSYTLDIARLGAGVVAGIGFIGAGTIMITRRKQVKGVTTAAGFWTSAIVGLALGAGYYEGAILTALLVLVAELFFSKFEHWMIASRRDLTVYLEYRDAATLTAVTELLKERRVRLMDVEITKTYNGEIGNPTALMTLHTEKGVDHEQLFAALAACDGVLDVEEL